MRKDIPANILPRLRTLTYTNPKCVLHELHLDHAIILRVVGDPEGGGYEWVIESVASNRSELEFSNCGYGQSAVALRDGLIAFLGLPQETQDSAGVRTVQAVPGLRCDLPAERDIAT